jgi:hypothetical protein
MRILLVLFVLYSMVADAQNIRKIAAYDNESSYTSGLYALSDTAVYRYSWYYQEWFYLKSDGLTRVDDTVRVSAIAVYNNKISNSSGIFVFTDTVVRNYNWYAQYWYPLSNAGLPRNIENKPDVYDLAVYGDSGSSSNSQLFALTHSGVYRYIWYYQQWYPLANTGLEVSNPMPEFGHLYAGVYPNPFAFGTAIDIVLPEDFRGSVDYAFFSESGQLLHREKVETTGGKVHYKVSSEKFLPGIYFCEIKAGNLRQVLKIIKQ